MNTRLKFALLTHSEKGFALPLALIIGLILIGTGVTMILRSQGDQSKAVGQKSRADGLTGTEAGLARVQDYLNTVRVMALTNSDRDSNNDCSLKECWATVTFPSSTETNLTPLQKELNSLQASATCNNSADSTKISGKIDEMRNILSNGGKDTINAKAGERRFLDYQIVSYKYAPYSSSSSATSATLGQGILTLEGRFRKTDTATVTDHGESRNRLVVSIPVVASYPVALSRNTIPALWISSGGIEDGTETSKITESNPKYSSGSKFQGDVVMSDANAFPGTRNVLRSNLECSINSSKIVQPSSAVAPAYQAKFFQSLTFPSLPSIPDASVPNVYNIGDLTTTTTIPRSDDKPVSSTLFNDGITTYVYIVNNINLKDNVVTIPTTGVRVVFYVKGDITTKDNGGIKHDCTGSTTCKPTDLQIFGYKKVETGQSAPQICLNDKNKTEAFIFAPEYNLGIKKEAKGSFTGAMWGKSWGKTASGSDCTENNQIAITQGATWDGLISNLMPARLKELPQIGSVAAWCEEAVSMTDVTSQCVPNVIKNSGSTSSSSTRSVPATSDQSTTSQTSK